VAGWWFNTPRCQQQRHTVRLHRVTCVIRARRRGEKHEVECEGKLWLDTDIRPVILSGVLLAPSFEVNLWSQGRLTDTVLYMVKPQTNATIRDIKTREEVTNGCRENALYKLNCPIRRPHQPATLLATATASPDDSLLHRRLGHPSLTATRKLLPSNAVLEVDQSVHIPQMQHLGSCLICKKGKQHVQASPSLLTELWSMCIDPLRFSGAFQATCNRRRGECCYIC
jgi:hypothetical protein